MIIIIEITIRSEFDRKSFITYYLTFYLFFLFYPLYYYNYLLNKPVSVQFTLTCNRICCRFSQLKVSEWFAIYHLNFAYFRLFHSSLRYLIFPFTLILISGKLSFDNNDPFQGHLLFVFFNSEIYWYGAIVHISINK